MPLLRHLCIKCIVLPRQARDKHRESTQKKSGVSLPGIFDTPTAQAVAFGKSLNDSTKICSLSPFNTYYIVQVRAREEHREGHFSFLSSD
jgi:hypothetical protein